MPENWQSAGFGLYVHWPFCQAKCPYCDFNSHVVDAYDQTRWKRAYLSEISRIGEKSQGRVLQSIFFGGGTPSLMDAEVVRAVIEAANSTWTPANDQEITLEANPSSVEAARFAQYRSAGVNRVSLGIQAINDSDLKALGRLHTVKEALTALDVARSQFDRVSFDLIYARQHQTLGDWRAELKRALAFGPDHLSLYQLTIEPGTAFGARLARGKLPGLPDEDLGADLYACTQELCVSAGLPAYEISNHARPGQESRHNLIYWRGGDYAGIGPGAHGRLTLEGVRLATATPLSPSEWLDAVERKGTGESPRLALDPEDRAAEDLMMGLRLRSGVDMARLQPLAASKSFAEKSAGLEGLGLIRMTDGRLAATERGRPVLNAILRELLPG